MAWVRARQSGGTGSEGPVPEPPTYFYMRNDGSDSTGTGAEDNPVLTPSKLMTLVNAFGPGGIGRVLPNTVPGAAYTFDPAITKLFEFTHSGDLANPIGIEGMPDANGNYPTFDGVLNILGTAGVTWSQIAGPIYTANATNGITVSIGAKTFTRANGTGSLSFVTLGFAAGQTFIPTNLDPLIDGLTFTLVTVTATVLTVAEVPAAAVVTPDTNAVLTVNLSNRWARTVVQYGSPSAIINGSLGAWKGLTTGLTAIGHFTQVTTTLTTWALSDPAAGGLTSITQMTGANAVSVNGPNYVSVKNFNFKNFAGRTISVAQGNSFYTSGLTITLGALTAIDICGNDNTVYNCNIHDIGFVTGAGEHGVDVRPPYDNVLIDTCIIYNVGEDGVQFTSIDSTDRPGTVTVNNCRIWDNAENAVDLKRGSEAIITNNLLDAGGGRSGGDSTEVITVHSGFAHMTINGNTLYQRSGASTCLHVAPFASGGNAVTSTRNFYCNVGGGGLFLNNENGGPPGDCTFAADIITVNNTGGGAVKDSDGTAGVTAVRSLKQCSLLNVGAAGTGLLMTPANSTWTTVEDTLIMSGGACISGAGATNIITGTAHVIGLNRTGATNVLVTLNGVTFSAAQCTDGTLAAAFPNMSGASAVAQTAGTSFINTNVCTSITRSGNTCTAILTVATGLQVGMPIWVRGAITAEDDYNGVWHVLSVATTTNANDTITFKIQDNATPTTPAATPGGISITTVRLAAGSPAGVRTNGGNQGILRDIMLLPYGAAGATPMGGYSTVSAV